MKIRYEAEIKDCGECKLHFKAVDVCLYDNQYGVTESYTNYPPCVLRPCPLEVKE